MPDIKEAYKIALEDAKKDYGDSELLACNDIGDRFVFAIGFEGRAIKGASLIAVDKNNGEISYLHLPDEDNFELLSKGTQVEVTDILCH